MPASDWRNMTAVMQAILSCKQGEMFADEPLKILDVGAGWGKYGVALREALDVWFERYEPATWKSTIDAVEIWPRWITPLHRHVYNNIFVEDYSDTVNERTGYDVVFIGDTLEHWNKNMGNRIVQRALFWNKRVVLCVPDGSNPSVLASGDALGGAKKYLDNPHERHQALFYPFEFTTGKFFTPTDGSACFVVRLPD